MTFIGVSSPNKPRPADEGVRYLADALVRVEANYQREGSGPGSRFEGRLLEDVQIELVLRLFSARLLGLLPGQRYVLLLELAGGHIDG